ncbi:hypothetical protein D039_1430A, partial [Vibrio parahaemolyticus EKP-028]
MTLPCTA